MPSAVHLSPILVPCVEGWEGGPNEEGWAAGVESEELGQAL